jgi:uncharacterized membrane protein YgcG
MTYRSPYKRLGPLCLCALTLLLLDAQAWAEKVRELKPIGYLSDFAGILDNQTKSKIDALCAEIDKKTGAQISVVTIHSLEGVEAADFGNRLFAQWGVGHKEDDRGVLILLAIDDRKYWVEVGYGLEPILPDGKVGGFGREAVPLLRQQNYSGAVLHLTNRIAEVIAADRNQTIESLSAPPSTNTNAAPAKTPADAPAWQETAFDKIFPVIWYGGIYLGYFVAGGIGLFQFVEKNERKKYFVAASVLVLGLVLVGYIRGQDFFAALLLFSFLAFSIVGIFVSAHLAGQKNRSKVGWGLLSTFFGSFSLLTVMYLPAKPAKPRKRSQPNRFFSLFGVRSGGGHGGSGGWGSFGGGGFGGFGGGSSGGGGAGGSR